MRLLLRQHLSKHIQKKGFNYFVAEAAPTEMSLSDVKRKKLSGSFSARYGNIYLRQALAGDRKSVRELRAGRRNLASQQHFVDAFRRLKIDPYDSGSDGLYRGEHLAAVRRGVAEWQLVGIHARAY